MKLILIMWINNEQFLNIKNKIQNIKHHINAITTDYFNLKKENEIWVKESNKLKIQNNKKEKIY